MIVDRLVQASDDKRGERLAAAFRGCGEYCPRCGAEMTYEHSSVYCPECHFKPGCCGGW